MGARVVSLLLLLVLLLAGCRQDQQMQFYIDNLNAEKRVLEDQLYELQYDYESKLDELEACRQQRNDDASAPTSQTPRSRQPAAGSALDDLFPAVPDLEPPTIEYGDPTDPDQNPDSEPTRSDNGDASEEDDSLEIDLGEEASNTAAGQVPRDRTVTRLYLNPALTGGKDLDGKAGDDGLRVVLEPRNHQNRFVPEPGRVTVVLLDPKQRTRVARWEFDAEQTALALQRAEKGGGIQLDLPWHGSPPEDPRLHLFVRYWPANGQAVQADREITITRPGQLAATWTPRSDDRSPGSDTRISVAEKQAGQSDKERPPAADTGERRATDAQRDGERRSASLPEWQPHR